MFEKVCQYCDISEKDCICDESHNETLIVNLKVNATKTTKQRQTKSANKFIVFQLLESQTCFTVMLVIVIPYFNFYLFHHVYVACDPSCGWQFSFHYPLRTLTFPRDLGLTKQGF